MRNDKGPILTIILVSIAILTIMAAVIFSAVRGDKTRIQRYTQPQPTQQEPNNHIFIKTQYIVIPGVENESFTELPPDYKILTNEWGGFSFMDGDGSIHPFWADGAWKTEEETISAAWLSHTRRFKERNGQLKPPLYQIVRTNQSK